VNEQLIVHSVLKTSNILLATVQEQQIAKITDFGLVKLTDLSAKSTATVAGASRGYPPPEQYEMGNNRVGPPTDIFSYAAILFEMLSGRVAFPHNAGESPLKTVARMLTGERPQLVRALATLSPELRGQPAIVAALDVELERATSPDPAKRHPNVLDFWGRLEGPLRDALQRGRSGASAERQAIRQSIPMAEDPSYAGSARMHPIRPSAPPQGFAVAAAGIPNERVKSVAFLDDESIFAAGAAGIYRFARPPGSAGGAWTLLSRPELAGRPPSGVARLPQGEVLLYGDRGLAVALSVTGTSRPVLPPDPDVAWLGAHTDDGDIVLVGARHSRPVGVLAEIGARGTHVRTLEGTHRLVSVTRVASGTFVACGPNGELVHIVPTALAESPSRAAHQEIPWGRTGHLYSLCRAFDGGAFAVGSGGHALRVGPPALGREPPVATLEVVQTTRDLLHVTLDARGVPWAVGGAARLLARDAGTWVRVPLAVPEIGFVSVAVRGQRFTIVAEDGAIIEGA
jgi:serine/threonine-protein kinase